MTNTPPNLRRAIREAAAGVVSPQHVDEVVDLAMHAVDRAFEVVTAAVKPASSPSAAVNAASIALSVIVVLAQAKLDQFAADAGALGLVAESTTVKFGGAHG